MKNKKSREPTNPLNREGEAPPCKYLPHKSGWQNGRSPLALDIPLRSSVYIYIYVYDVPRWEQLPKRTFLNRKREYRDLHTAEKTQAPRLRRVEARHALGIARSVYRYRFIGRSLGQLRIPTGEGLICSWERERQIHRMYLSLFLSLSSGIE